MVRTLPDYQPQTDLRIFSDQYLSTAHNLVSVNLTARQGDKVLNEGLEANCASLFSSLALWENSTGGQRDLEWSGIVERLRRIIGLLSQIFPSGGSDAMGGCISQAIAPALGLDAIKSCQYFSQWCG
jgi:spore maturation protein SpmA